MNDQCPLLANLVIRSNLLSANYQAELGRVSVFELRDIRDRTGLGIDLNPSCPNKVTPRQQEQWRDHLFWGDRSVSLDDEHRRHSWMEALADQVFNRIEAFEERPDEEEGFELLYVTEQLRRASIRPGC